MTGNVSYSTADGTIRPSIWRDMVEGEARPVTLHLRPALGTRTITAVTFDSCPGGLTFADAAVSDGVSVTASMTAERAADYVITATCTLSDGSVMKPRVQLRVVCEGGV